MNNEIKRRIEEEAERTNENWGSFHDFVEGAQTLHRIYSELAGKGDEEAAKTFVSGRDSGMLPEHLERSLGIAEYEAYLAACAVKNAQLYEAVCDANMKAFNQLNEKDAEIASKDVQIEAWRGAVDKLTLTLMERKEEIAQLREMLGRAKGFISWGAGVHEEHDAWLSDLEALEKGGVEA